MEDREIRKDAANAIVAYVREKGGSLQAQVQATVEKVTKEGGTLLVVAEESQVLVVIYLKDVINSEIKGRLTELRCLGIKTMMITGDNPLTAAIATAMTGDGTTTPRPWPRPTLVWP